MAIHALTPAMLIAGASTMLGGGGTRGPGIAQMLDVVGLGPDEPWSAAFVYHVGHWSHDDRDAKGGTMWPLPATGDCEVLAAFGRRHGIVRSMPLVGDVCLRRAVPEGPLDRAGIVAQVDAFEEGTGEEGAVVAIQLIEGDTTARGRRSGLGVYRLRWQIVLDGQTLFLRWVELDGRRALGNPHVPSDVVDGRLVLRQVA